MIIGLTGQSGAGKTSVCDILKSESDIAVIDCDVIARNVAKKGSDFVKEISRIYPEAVCKDFELDRKAVSRIVFSDKEELKRYEGIIFPYITRDIKQEIKKLENEGRSIIILDAPTLFEAGADKLCDMIISVIADKQTRLERIRKRDGLPDELILKRFSSQKSSKFFIENSDYYINNNKGSEELYKETKNIIDFIKERQNGKKETE